MTKFLVCHPRKEDPDYEYYQKWPAARICAQVLNTERAGRVLENDEVSATLFLGIAAVAHDGSLETLLSSASYAEDPGRRSSGFNRTSEAVLSDDSGTLDINQSIQAHGSFCPPDKRHEQLGNTSVEDGKPQWCRFQDEAAQWTFEKRQGETYVTRVEFTLFLPSSR